MPLLDDDKANAASSPRVLGGGGRSLGNTIYVCIASRMRPTTEEGTGEEDELEAA